MQQPFSAFDELREALGDQVRSIRVERDDEIYLIAGSSDVRPIVNYLRREYEARVVAVFAEDRRWAEGIYYNYYVMERRGNPAYLVVQAPVSAGIPEFASLSAELPSLNWQEREIQDWFGIEAVGHPNPRRVALHDNWPDVHPLRKDFDLRTMLPPFEGERHVYRPALGEGVLQVPVGPVHAGIIEPGHFNFAVAGEPILYLQLRMFYTHKGTEKLFENLPVHKAVFLAESISGDSSFSHGTAFCQAIEWAAEIEPPTPALLMRTILLELERIYNHVADIGAIATDVGFVVANAHATRIREFMVTLNEHLTGSRLLRGMVCIGGVRRDWDSRQLDTLRDHAGDVRTRVRGPGGPGQLIAIPRATVWRRTGILRPEKARDLGIVGVGGRASGVDLDVRRDHPYAAYARFPFRVPVYQEGDVLRRMQVRIDEVRESVSHHPTRSRMRSRRTPVAPSGATSRPGRLRHRRGGRLARRNHPLGSHRRRTTASSAARSKTLR